MPVRCIEIVKLRLKDLPPSKLVSAHERSATDIRTRHPGLVASSLARLDDGTYVDILSWASREDAQAALDGGSEIPGFVAWSELIVEILSFDMAEVVEDSA